jgi:hypothetical protein
MLQVLVFDVYLVNILLPNNTHVESAQQDDIKEVTEPQDVSLVQQEDIMLEQELAHVVSVQQENILLLAGVAVEHVQQESTPVHHGGDVLLVLLELTSLAQAKEDAQIAVLVDTLARVQDHVQVVQEVLITLLGERVAVRTVQLESILALDTVNVAYVLRELTPRHAGVVVTIVQQVVIPKQVLLERILVMLPTSKDVLIVPLELIPVRRRRAVPAVPQASTLPAEDGAHVLHVQLVVTPALVGQVAASAQLESTKTRQVSQDVSAVLQATINHTRVRPHVMDVQLVNTVREQLLVVLFVPLVSTLVLTGVIAVLVV